MEAFLTGLTSFPLWQRTLGQSEGADERHARLSTAFREFRKRASQLVGEIHRHLPNLTVHDVSHLDDLWRVAGEIAGPNYPLNPAEAFVLGGAFLLHDAGHAVACFSGGLDEIKETSEWKDAAAMVRRQSDERATDAAREQLTLFHVLRHLHAKKAHTLATQAWASPLGPLYLLEDSDLRGYYGDLIGRIAESHHWSPLRVVREFEKRRIPPPSYLHTDWVVDAMKVAFLLRVADAAHIDDHRAPWFLFALRRPDQHSEPHWRFQAKLGQPLRTAKGELKFGSGSPFHRDERNAWWLAYETACMVDRELRQAHALLEENGRLPFAAIAVERAQSPEAFAANVTTDGWEPVDVAPSAKNVARLAATLGGTKLYGDRPELALRELLQNSADAVRSLRALGAIGPDEGGIDVWLDVDPSSSGGRLNVRDHGIGMSRFVLTDVLLDFGSSLWSNDAVRAQIPGLAASGFRAIGQFGIGFFSVFMLGRKVQVVTRRHDKADGDDSDQWLLEFENGLSDRPSLRVPTASERLPRHGTLITVWLNAAAIRKLAPYITPGVGRLHDALSSMEALFPMLEAKQPKPKTQLEQMHDSFCGLVAQLCPTLDIRVRAGLNGNFRDAVIPGDWLRLSDAEVVNRAKGLYADRTPALRPLTNVAGQVIGRIAYIGESYSEGALLSHQGIAAGRMQCLAGLLLADNNVDAARTEARPIATLADWRRWAWEEIQASAPRLKVTRLAILHAFVPERDLPIYTLGSRRLTQTELVEWLRTAKQVTLHEGFPTHEDYDDVSSDRFSSDLRLADDVLFVANERKNLLLEALQIAPIDYAMRVQDLIYSTWGEDGVHEDIVEDDEFVVATVGKYEVQRTTSIFERK